MKLFARNIQVPILTIAYAAILSIFAAMPSRAHEVIPAVADVTISDDRVDLQIRLTAEAILAGIDLSQVIDTNDAPQAQDYDALRALPPDALTAQIQTLWDDIAANITLTRGGTPVPLTLDAVAVDPVGDVALPRYSVLSLSADTGSGPVTFAWAASYGGIVLRQMGGDTPVTEFLQNGATSQAMSLGGTAPAQTALSAFVSYIPVGFDHIVPKGLDHILFVLGLFFLTAGLRALIWQVSAFTLAHTVTLAAGALGWVNVSGAIVEPLIAASIVFVAVENILAKGLSPWRPVIIFGFGLLHGLGFASVLGDFGLPADHFIPALIGFNIGVELGQLAVIAVAFVLLGLWFRTRPWYRARIAIPASLIIAAVGTWWFVERVFL